jgi:hypothetical protein
MTGSERRTSILFVASIFHIWVAKPNETHRIALFSGHGIFLASLHIPFRNVISLKDLPSQADHSSLTMPLNDTKPNLKKPLRGVNFPAHRTNKGNM